MKNLHNNGEDGFSLLELVIAIGVILVLTVGGLIGYGKYQDNARQAIVESAAQQSAKGALAYESNHNSSQTAEDAVEAYNASAKADTVSVELERRENGCMRFIATYKGHKNQAVREIDCSDIGNPPNGNDDGDSGSNGNENEDDGGTTTPPVEDGSFIKLANACSYKKGVLGVGSKVIINWEVSEGYNLDDVSLKASTSGIGSELKEISGFKLSSNTTRTGTNTYMTEIPTNMLGGLLGLGEELEIALSVQGKDSVKSVSIATNAGLVAGIDGSCRSLDESGTENNGSSGSGGTSDSGGSNGDNTGSDGSSCNEVPLLRYTYKFKTEGSVRPTDYRIEDETGKMLTSGIVHIYTGDTYWVNYEMPCDEVEGWVPPQNKVILTGTSFGRVEFVVKPVAYRTYRYDGKPAGGADYLQVFDAGVFQVSSDGVWNFNIDDCEKYKVCYEPYKIETR